MTTTEKMPGGGNGAQAPDRAAPSMEKAPDAKAGGNGDGGPPDVLSIEDARKTLVEKYKEKAISENDPLLMLVTLHQSIMEDYEEKNHA